MSHKYDVYIGILPDSYLATILSDRITCPLGQLVLASYAKERVDGLEAVVFNGLRTNDKIMLDRIREEVNRGKKVAVGITLLAGNTINAFKIAEQAHDLGADVYVGGTEATMVGGGILETRDYIKALIFGAGERILVGILNEENFDDIPNIAYRKDGRIKKNTANLFELDFQNIKIDYKLLHDLGKHEGISYLYGNDCQHAKKRCYFCGRQSLGIGFRDPRLVWAELLDLYQTGITKFYNTMDNAAVNLERFREFASFKPHQMRFDMHRTFINARDVSPETAQLLRDMNAVAAIGLESFSMLEKVGKGSTELIDNLRAIQLCRDEHIPLFLSMVYGLPGEDENTLKENEEWIEFIFREFGETIDSLHVSPLMVTTGSRAYDDLMRIPDIRRKYSSKTLPYDTIELSRDYFSQFCNIPRDVALYYIHQLYSKVKQINPKTRFSSHVHHTETDIKGIGPDE